MPLILSCTDGSAYAASVYDHSAWAARRMNAAVRVLHILDPHRERADLADWSGAIGVDARDHLEADLVALEEAKGQLAQVRSKAILDEARRSLSAAGVAEITTEHRRGSLVEALEEFEAAADLVILGKRGEAADFAKLHLGTNVERVIRSCHHPVLVTSRAFRPVQRFLIAFDGGPSAQKAVAYAASEPLLRGLEAHLLTAGSGRALIDRELQVAKNALEGAGYSVTARHIPGEPEKVIAEVVRNEGMDLLVMGAYGHSRIRHLIVGSTTTTMIRTCLVPVLMFR